MTDIKKTSIFVAVALVMCATAVWATRPSVRSGQAVFQDQGKPFFPDFKDPLVCTSLEVIDYDPDTAAIIPFNVMLKDGKWVIPSHNDYPADAKDRLAKTAAGVIDLRKDVIVSESADQHEDFGVVDPASKSPSLKGRGKKVTLKNKSGEVLANFIIGKEVKGRTGQRYVRVPDQKVTYGVNVNVDLSTKFADWIETNLLKLDAFKMRSVTFDNHKVDPEAGSFTQGDVFKIERKESSSPWTLTTLVPEKTELPPDQEVDSTKVSNLTSALADLKIVGVRPKPAGLTKELKAAGEGKGVALSRASQLSLQNKGFYLTRDGRLLSNQGDVIPTTEEGIVYTLRFGEVTFATGDALTAGNEEEEKSKAAADGKKPEGASESRYLFVTAAFDPSLMPPAPQPPADDAALPADPFKRTAKERADKSRADTEKYERDKAEYDRKLEAGKKTAKELTDRFAGWYYVVPGDAFRSVVVDRAALVKKKEDKPAAGIPTSPPPFPIPGMPHP